ncbi:MAG: hypothetical protein PHT57_02685 [Rhodoferax sp.]|nr:hypothetical protein [Rhodoferax sp.]
MLFVACNGFEPTAFDQYGVLDAYTEFFDWRFNRRFFASIGFGSQRKSTY